MAAVDCGTQRALALRVIGLNEPMPFGVLIVVQVPFGTSFQALPW